MTFQGAGSGVEPGRLRPAWELSKTVLGNSTVHNRGYWKTGHNLGKPARSITRSSSCLLQNIVLVNILQFSDAFKFKPEGAGVCPRNGGDVRSGPKYASVVVNSLQGHKSLSGAFHGNFRSDEDKREILQVNRLNQEAGQAILNLFSLWKSFASSRLAAG